MAKKAAAKKAVKKKPEGSVSISLRVNNTDYTSTSDTLGEALDNLPAIVPHTKASFTVITEKMPHGKTFTLTIPGYRRLFYPGMTGQVQRAVFIKRFL